MKKLVLILLCLPFIGFAQSVPQGINYQAVARDANGDVLMNQALTIQFSVISDITTGIISWQETHQDTTNAYGLFTAIIGQGTSTGAPATSATFDVIDWGASNHLLKVEIDYGSGLVDMGTTAFMSVPYALQAGNPGADSTMIANMIAASYPMIPYEPWNQNSVNSDDGIMTRQHGYFIRFIAPSTGYYTHAMMLAGTSGFGSAVPSYVGMAIYSNDDTYSAAMPPGGFDAHGLPSTLLGEGTLWGLSVFNYKNEYNKVTFVSPIHLVANEIYWFAFGYSTVSSSANPTLTGYYPRYADYNTNYNSVLTYSGNIYNGAFNTAFTSGVDFYTSNNACWFRLYKAE